MPLDPRLYGQFEAPDIMGGIERGIKMSDLIQQRRKAAAEEQKQSRIRDIISQNTSVDDKGNVSFNPQGITTLVQAGAHEQALALAGQNQAMQKNKMEFDQMKAKADLSEIGNSLGLIRQNPKLWESEVIRLRDKGIDVSRELNPDGTVKPYDPNHVEALWKQTDQYNKHFEQQLTDAKLKNTQADTAKKWAEVGEIGKKKEGDVGKVAGELRKERTGLQTTKDTAAIASTYNSMRTLGQDPSGASDMSLVFSYMKMLDPGSTVREGEYANARNTAGIPDQVLNAYNRARDGKFLTEQQRKDFISQAKKKYDSQFEVQKKIDSQYEALAKKAGVDPQDVILNFEIHAGGEKPQTIQQNGHTYTLNPTTGEYE